MATEISAGGVIVHISRAGRKVLLMKDMHGSWTFPKGKIEKDEDIKNTALREIEEEVGVTHLQYIAKLTPAKYWYFRGTPIRKTVQYYLFRSKTLQKPIVQTEEGITEARWMLFAEAKKLLGYPKTNIPLLKEALHILQTRKNIGE